MGYRSFTDSDGVGWQIWDVIPRYNYQAAERRRVPREGEAVAVTPYRPESFDRRSSASAFSVPAGMAAGWLCFESSAEKRRLAPIPDGWDRLTDGELTELCQQAQIVGRSSVRTGEVSR
jgi:hypothetical protein